MIRILRFKETSGWSRCGIPLRVVWVSPRQLVILLASYLAGLLVATPLQTATLKIVPMAAFILAGVVIAFWKVMMLTPEQRIMARLRGLTRMSQNVETSARRGKIATRAESPVEKAFEIESDSAESLVPLSISGRWKRTKLPRKVSLYVDGVPRARAEALATPVSDAESGYTIVFLPSASDIRVRELEVESRARRSPSTGRRWK